MSTTTVHLTNAAERIKKALARDFKLTSNSSLSYAETYASAMSPVLINTDLKKLFPKASDTKLTEMTNAFNEFSDEFSMHSPLRASHFFAQIRQEVGPEVANLSENLNYNVNALTSKFSYFKNNPTEAALYGRSNAHAADWEAIANRVYANRIGNGDVTSGDGWKYRGRGYIQLTGKANYEAINNIIQTKFPNAGIDIVKNPDALLTSKGGMVSAMAFWEQKNLNTIADQGSVDDITAVVNKHTNSYSQRTTHFNTITASLGGLFSPAR